MSAQLQRLPQPAIRLTRRLPGKQSERGASMVEFAIIISLLFLLVFGIVQFGIAFNRDNGIKAAAKEGARAASVGGSEAEITSRIRDTQSMFASDDIQVKIDYSTDNGTNYVMICNDATNTPHACDKDSGGTAPPSPCGVASLGSLIRVTATVPGTVGGGRYAIVIPFWGNAKITFVGDGVFRCENTT